MPQVNSALGAERMALSNVVSALRGEEPLSTVFWKYYVLGIVLMLLLVVLIYFLEVFLVVLLPVVFSPVAIASCFYILYQVWVTISLWRCAFNVRNALWGYLCRAYVLCVVAYCIHALIQASFE